MRRLAIVLVLLAVCACRKANDVRPSDLGTPLSSVLGTEGSSGFERALTVRPFSFPADHGPHPTFRTEWWYFTGNLGDREGERYGFQLTFFRSALVADPPKRRSQWAANQIYLAHFAVTDAKAQRFFSAERYARVALDLAGAIDSPFEVWAGAWRAKSVDRSFLPLTLAASQGAGENAVAIDLRIAPGKPPVLQGDHGLSLKSVGPDAVPNASYYYSMTRLPASGTLTLDGREREVAGTAWLDREWSTSALASNQVGWDWFALQLDDGRDLMYYQLRRRDGTSDPTSAGSLTDARGRAVPFRRESVALTPRGEWQSPRSGARYPTAWRLAVPTHGLDLELIPLLADQELDVSFRYWEGAVEVRDARTRTPLGRGYIEMTGYGLPR